MKKQRKKTSLHVIVGVILIGAATIAVYYPALRAGYVWDDQALTDNWLIRAPNGIAKIWTEPSLNRHETHYWPLTYTTFWLEYRLWDYEPFGYHLINVLLHILNALLIWYLLRRLSVPGAWLAAALFALHPVHVESVAWIIERKDVLSMFFYLLAFIAFERFTTSRRTEFYVCSIALFLCALLSKSITITFPAALLFFLWWKRKKIHAQDFLRLLPFFIIAVAHAAIDLQLVRKIETTHFDLNVVNRCLLAARSIGFYVQKIVLPYPLMPFYPRWEINPNNIQLYLFLLIELGIIAFLLLRARRRGKGPTVAVLFFIVTLSPILGFIDFNFMGHSYVADRFQYLASLGIIALIAAALSTLSRRMKIPLPFQTAVLILILGILGILTWCQATIYKDEETLFSAAIKRNPTSASAHNNLGGYYLENLRNEEALTYFRKALECRPGWTDAHNNLGVVLERLGKREEALAHYRIAMEIHPEYPDVHYNYAGVLVKQGKFEEAYHHYQTAVRYKPYYPEAYHNMGVILVKKNQMKEAADLFRKSIRIKPDYAQGHYNLGVTLVNMGFADEGMSHLCKSIELNPAHTKAYLKIAEEKHKQNKIEEAMFYLKEVLRINPNIVRAHNNLGVFYYQQHKFGEALFHFSEAVRIDPHYTDAINNLNSTKAMIEKK